MASWLKETVSYLEQNSENATQLVRKLLNTVNSRRISAGVCDSVAVIMVPHSDARTSERSHKEGSERMSDEELNDNAWNLAWFCAKSNLLKEGETATVIDDNHDYAITLSRGRLSLTVTTVFRTRKGQNRYVDREDIVFVIPEGTKKIVRLSKPEHFKKCRVVRKK